jgi:hypothetical protein
MTQPRLNNLSLICIENDILENIDFNDIIHDFSTSKCREHLCNVVPVIGVPALLILFEMWWCDTYPWQSPKLWPRGTLIRGEFFTQFLTLIL